MTTASKRNPSNPNEEGPYGLTARYGAGGRLEWNPADQPTGLYVPYEEGEMASSSTFALTIHEYCSYGMWLAGATHLEGTVWHLLRRYRQVAGLEAIEPYVAIILNALIPEATTGSAYAYQWESVVPELRRQLRRVGFPFGHPYRNLDDAYHSFAWFYVRLPDRIRMGLLSGDYDARTRGMEPAAGGEVVI